jgi:tetratricopeptide (TPR) repeat protein
MQTVSFYSYKGGVGRTLALAHTAIHLAKNNIKVCILDIDLEAPGILFKFQKNPDFSKKGVLDYIYDCIEGRVPVNIDDYFYTFQNVSEEGYIKIMSAGKDINTTEYFNKLSEIRWEALFFNNKNNDYPNGLEYFVNLSELIETQIRPDYLFIDSRSGVTVMSKVCNSVLPDIVVMLLANNEENFNGSKIIYDHIINSPYKLSKKNISVICSLTRIPMPLSEEDLHKQSEINSKVNSVFGNNSASYQDDVVIIHSNRDTEYEESSLLQYKDTIARDIDFEYYQLLTKIVDIELLVRRKNLIRNKPKHSLIEFDLHGYIGSELNDYYLSLDKESLYNKLKDNIEKNPYLIKIYYKRALEEAYFGNIFEAIGLLSKAIKLGFVKNDWIAKVYYLRGLIFLYDLNNYFYALNDLNKINNNYQSFKNASFYCNLAVCMIYLNQYNEAIQYLNESQSLDSKYYRPYLLRAICKFIRLLDVDQFQIVYFRSKNTTKQIITDFDKAIDLNNKIANSYFCRGNIYNIMGKDKEAIDDYDKAISLNPKYVNAYIARGNYYFKNEEYQKALEDCTKAIEIEPDYEILYDNRARTYIILGEYDKAIADYNKLLEINHIQDDYYYLSRGIAYIYLKKYSDAIIDFTEAIKIAPKTFNSYNYRGNIYFKLGKFDEALDDCNKSIELGCDNSVPYRLRALIYENKGEYDKAEKDNKKAQELEKEYSTEEYAEIITYGKIISTDTLPVKYIDGSDIEFTLIEYNGRKLLTDNGKTWKMIVKMYNIKELNIQEIFETIPKELKVILINNIYAIEINEETPFEKCKYILFKCISFFNMINILYFPDKESKMQMDDKKFKIYENSKENVIKNKNPIERFNFYVQYLIVHIDYEFILVERDGKVILTDQGRTYQMLDKDYILEDDDVQENINAAMRICDVVQDGNEFIIPIKTYEVNKNPKENEKIIEAIYRLFECVSFIDIMRIKYF